MSYFHKIFGTDLKGIKSTTLVYKHKVSDQKRAASSADDRVSLCLWRLGSDLDLLWCCQLGDNDRPLQCLMHSLIIALSVFHG